MYYNGFNLLIDLVLVSITAVLFYRSGYVYGGIRALQALVAELKTNGNDMSSEEARELYAEWLMEDQRERDNEENKI